MTFKEPVLFLLSENMVTLPRDDMTLAIAIGNKSKRFYFAFYGTSTIQHDYITIYCLAIKIKKS